MGERPYAAEMAGAGFNLTEHPDKIRYVMAASIEPCEVKPDYFAACFFPEEIAAGNGSA
jgi:hypothetical protein